MPSTLRCLLVVAGLLAVPVQALADGDPLVNGGSVLGTLSFSGDVNQHDTIAQVDDFLVVHVAEVDYPLAPGAELRNMNGTLVDEHTDSTVAQLEYRVTLAGDYEVSVRDTTAGQQVGDYFVHFVRTSGPLNVDVGDSGPALTNGASHPAVLQLGGELDAFEFGAFAGAEVTLEMEDVDTAVTPWIRVYGPGGFSRGISDPSLASLSFIAPASGRYVAVAADNTASNLATGAYVLRYDSTGDLPLVSSVPLPSWSPGVLAVVLVTVGATRSHRLARASTSPRPVTRA